MAAPEAVLFDISGTLLCGLEPIPGAPEAVEAMRARWTVRYFTNNPGLHSEQATERLQAAGFAARASDVVSAAAMTAAYVAEQFSGKRVLVLGGDGLRGVCAAQTLVVVDELPIDVVVVGGAGRLDSARLTLACRAIWEGAALVSTGLDKRVAGAAGELYPGTGSIVKAIEWATHVQADVRGKPSPWAAQAALRLLGTSGAASVVVGDSCDEDVALGKEMGARTALVLSGVTTERDLARLPAALRPDAVFASVSPQLVDWIAAQV